MNNIELKNTEEKKQKRNPKTKGSLEEREQNRVVITRDANAAIEEMARTVNLGFDGSTISKSDIANYMFLNITKLISESDIKAIRTLHFDERRVLGSLLRAENELPEELKKAIRAHYGISDKEKKKNLRPHMELSTEAAVDNSK
jgi:hypothetical protein